MFDRVLNMLLYLKTYKKTQNVSMKEFFIKSKVAKKSTVCKKVY